jgi:putative spermidine/putrescine transport system substrate-binding protein
MSASDKFWTTVCTVSLLVVRTSSPREQLRRICGDENVSNSIPSESFSNQGANHENGGTNMMRKKRKVSITLVLCLAMAALVVSGCISQEEEKAPTTTQPPEKQKVVLGTFAGPYEDYVKEIAAGFEAETGIQVEVVAVNSDNEWISKIKLWGDEPEVHVMYLGLPRFIRGALDGLWAPLNLDNIPQWKNLYQVGLDAGKGTDGVQYGLPYDFAAWGIIYQKERVPEPPTSWKDLWNVEKFGNVGSETWFDQFYAATGATWGYAPEQYEEIIAKIKELQDSGGLRLAESYSKMQTMLQMGDINLSGCWDGRAYTFEKAGVDVGWVIPQEGAVAWIGLLAIPKGVPNQELAEKLINYIISPGPQLTFVDLIHYGSPNKLTQLTPELQAMVVDGEQEINSLIGMEYYWYMAQHYDEIQELWEREILGG